MIFDLRIYTFRNGAKMNAWLKVYEEYAFPIQQKYLGKPVLVSTTEVGPLNQVVHIWQYESQGDRENRRNTMVKDAGWPEFLKRSAELDAVHTQENRLLKSTSFSPL